MNSKLGKYFLVLLLFMAICSNAYSAEYICKVKGREVKQGDWWYKASLTHVWQGVINGTETRNSDRIAGLYDFDLCYLAGLDETGGENADYVLVSVSTQMGFGNGAGFSKLGGVGGLFGSTDLALGDQDFYVDKCFVEFTCMERQLTFDVGKILMVDFFDTSRVANSEFSQFMASQLVNNLAIPWPSKGLGAVATYSKDESWYVRAGVIDAQSNKREMGFKTAFHDEDYWLSMAEVGFDPKLCGMPGMYRFIAWYDPQDKSYFDDAAKTKRDDLGFALSFDQDVSDDTTLFFRYGWANDSYNKVEDTISFGGEIRAPFEGREADVFGVGYANNIISSKSTAPGETDKAEIIEAYYNYKLNDNINISPSVQYVFDPGVSSSKTAATVLGVRVRAVF